MNPLTPPPPSTLSSPVACFMRRGTRESSCSCGHSSLAFRTISKYYCDWPTYQSDVDFPGFKCSVRNILWIALSLRAAVWAAFVQEIFSWWAFHVTFHVFSRDGRFHVILPSMINYTRCNLTQHVPNSGTESGVSGRRTLLAMKLTTMAERIEMKVWMAPQVFVRCI